MDLDLRKLRYFVAVAEGHRPRNKCGCSSRGDPPNWDGGPSHPGDQDILVYVRLCAYFPVGCQSDELMTSAWRGKTLCINTRWTSSSRSRQMSSSTVRR
jgi:hypothetical protein